ncbi:MAG TPA: DUF2232 domain-containing protein [Gemmatimonadales bacterium]|nr:DUF2232 domain-containing protein [Gemmatimonadales bacterium]
MEAAAPSAGRRAGAGAVLGLLGFLVLAPPAFVLGPLAALLALSKPGTWRERVWLGMAVALTVFWLASPGDLPHQVIRAAGMGLAGATLAVVISGRPIKGFRAAITATMAAVFGTVTWGAILGIDFEAFRTAVESDLKAGYQQLFGPSGDAGVPEETERLLTSLSESAGSMAALYPGLLTVLAAGGVLLAWSWTHRIAERPVGLAMGPFRGFRFNDHVIWGAIFTLALAIAPVGQGVKLLAANLLVVWVALYLARGLAVVVKLVAGSPLPVRVVSVVFGLLLQPFSSGALLAVGLADTWLDFRRRPPPAPGGRAP